MLGSVRRVEDPRLLRGRGQYVGDLRLAGQLEVAFLRSPHAHAHLRSLDVAAALSAPGVVTVLTGNEAATLTRPFRPVLGVPGFNVCEQPVMATDRVRFVGEAVAAVVAENRYLAEDALDLIEADYEPLPPVTDARAALEDGAPLLHEEWGSNAHATSTLNVGDVDAAFASAEVVFRRHFVTGRYTGVPMENRAVLASASEGELVVWSSTQVPHLLRTQLADVLGFPEHLLRVVAPDVGGGFGVKASIYPEEAVVALLSLQLGRPVRWLEDRREHLQSATHARQQDLIVDVAADRDGTLRAVQFDLVGDIGAYSSFPLTSAIETLQTARHLPGPYRFQNYRQNTRAAVTNKVSVGPCRAVSRPVGSLVMETAMDLIAEATGLDPADVRRRNLVTAEEMPYTSISNQVYDSGRYQESLDRALEMLDYRGFRDEQRRALDEGRYLGVGMATYVEQTAQGSQSFNSRGMEHVAGYDSAIVRMDPSGLVFVAVGVSDHGQGHHTTLAQIAARELGVRFEDVKVVHGDTAVSPYGMGTFSSRSAVCGGGAVVKASEKLRAKLTRIAGHLLEVAPEDVELRDGAAMVMGAPDRRVTFRDLARIAHLNVSRLPPGEEPELVASGHYDAGNGTYAYASHAGIVEVDPETGIARFLRYVVVEDCGTMLNPMIVDGQVHGAVAQGIGGAAYEELIYGDDGQLLTSTFVDYLMPTSVEVPRMEVEHMVTPSPHTPLGMKGMGEGGTVTPGSVLASAVADALRPFGVRFTELPITPDKIRRAVREAQRR